MAGNKKYYFTLIAIVAIVAIVGIAFMMNSRGIDSEGIKSNTIGHATNSNSPYGYLDALSCDTIFGWAIDPNNAAPLHIKVYLDSPDNENNLLADILANAPSGDVGPHRFGHAFTPSQKARFQDGKQHTFYVIAIGIGEDGSPEGNNAPLTNSPKVMNCARPPQGYLDAATCDYLAGWAIDPDWSDAISIHFYLDYPAGQGPALTGETANKQRPDVGAHAFHHIFTEMEKAKLADGKEHTIYAYAIGKNANGADDGMNAELALSQKRVYCPERFIPTQANSEFKISPSGSDKSPPDYVITNGRLTIGVSKRYGGGISYLKDNTIPDDSVAKGNIINYGNAGALFTTALWELPVDENELRLCYLTQQTYSNSKRSCAEPCLQKTSWGMCLEGICTCGDSVLPNYNPTQGGYLGNGWAGNPNVNMIAITSNSIYTSTRMVNYNFAYDASKKGNEIKSPYPDNTNVNEWQTDFWVDTRIMLHPKMKNVAVVDTTITYCKDKATSCKKQIKLEDAQLSTFFAAEPIYPQPEYRGPYGRLIFYGANGLTKLDSYTGNIETSENWVGLLQKNQDYGFGMSVLKYKSGIIESTIIKKGYRGSTTSASVAATQPQLTQFENYNIGSEEIFIPGGKRMLYTLAPGSWFRFRTYVATGTVEEIRNSLLQAQNDI